MPADSVSGQDHGVRSARDARRTNVFTIAPGRPFLESLARAIFAGDLPRPGGRPPTALDLPRITLLLPTRRACRAMPAAFLRVSGGKATLLPRIRPIADVDEEASLLAGLAASDTPGEGGVSSELTLPPAVSEIERRLVLSLLVLRWSKMVKEEGAGGAHPAGPAGTPAQAAHLAAELARLMDSIEAEQADIERLGGLVRPELSEHWQQTLDFLSIITETWPAYLAERGLVSPVARRARLLAGEASLLAGSPCDAPVIIAGIAASQPVLLPLIETVAGLAHGALILPGLDLHLDEESWAVLASDHPEHPQHGMARLLADLGLDRSEVAVLPGAEPDEASPNEAIQERMDLLSEAMRPAHGTHRWPIFIAGARRERITGALDGVTRIDAPTAHDEAEAIALILRRAVETPKKTAALATPDRTLARRVAARLACWGLHVDDSAGRPFAKTAPGAFLDLIVTAIEEAFRPRALMALLGHPLTRLGLAPGEVRAAARTLELIVFRQPYLGHGLGGLQDALDRAEASQDEWAPHPAIRRARRHRLDAARDLVGRLEAAYGPLKALIGHGSTEPHTLRRFAGAHVSVAEALACGENGASDILWAGAGGEVAAVFFAGLMDENIRGPELEPEDYPAFYRTLVAGEVVRLGQPLHPRLFIWGPREARLMNADVLVLGGLNEGVWPRIAEPDPWLSRPMRRDLGLSPPEVRIGLGAHDFTQLLGGGGRGSTVYLTRAAKVDGVPSVPSRWLMRLGTLLAGLGLDDALDAPADEPWLAWARARDDVAERITIRAPEPRPPVGLRPRRLSVTRIESWIANPFSIYARHILGLQPLPQFGREPDAALRGQVLHRALHLFGMRHPTELPGDIAGGLIAVMDDVLADMIAHPRVATFWRHRLARFARWFGETEPARRAGIARSLTEVAGERVLNAPAGPFTLTARADRIDIGEDGAITIYDYKTGAPPNPSRVIDGTAPQLPLEAAIALKGGFPGINARTVSGLTYIRATGGDPAGEEKSVGSASPDSLAPDSLAMTALDNLKALIAAFDHQETPYSAIRRSGSAFEALYRRDDYAHLARVGEWSLGEGVGG